MTHRTIEVPLAAVDAVNIAAEHATMVERPDTPDEILLVTATEDVLERVAAAADEHARLDLAAAEEPGRGRTPAPVDYPNAASDPGFDRAHALLAELAAREPRLHVFWCHAERARLLGRVDAWAETLRQANVYATDLRRHTAGL